MGLNNVITLTGNQSSNKHLFNCSNVGGADIFQCKFDEVVAHGNTYVDFYNSRTGQVLMLVIRQAAMGGKTINWPVTVKWPEAIVRAQTASPNAIDSYTVVRIMDDASGQPVYLLTDSPDYTFNFPS
jgi:hypothetical protein